MRHTLILMLAAVAAPLAPRQGAHTISPGMSRAQVITAFGAPITARDQDAFTYLFYRNTCGRTCGMNDIVILRRDSVVDAVLRSSDRHYSGTSSSPVAIPPKVAAHLKAGEAPPVGMPAAAKASPVRLGPPRSARKSPPAISEPAKPQPVKPGSSAVRDTASVRPPMRPAPATDTRPSIPVKTEQVTPAPKKP